MMNIDLPLVLVIASFLGIIIWLYDFFVLRKKRHRAVAALQAVYPAWDAAGSPDKYPYQQGLLTALHEPWIVRETKSFLPIILVVLIIRSFIVEPFQIPSSSMEPTLDIGDFILVNKFTYGIRLPVSNTKVIAINEPQRGEVMVFFPPNDARYFIKRVIGLPGDYIEYRDKVLYVNGEQQRLQPVEYTALNFEWRDLFEENLDGVKHAIYNDPHRQAHNAAFVVRPGHYFMMGDNRDNSSDSRVWGQVPEENIVGKAFLIWMHWKDWKSLPSFTTVGSIK